MSFSKELNQMGKEFLQKVTSEMKETKVVKIYTYADVNGKFCKVEAFICATPLSESEIQTEFNQLNNLS